MECQVDKKVHFRHLLLYEFNKGSTAAEATRQICAVCVGGCYCSEDSPKPTPRPKPDLHPQKIMLGVWWDMQGIIHREMLQRNQTINAALYCEQLRRVHTTVQEKRPHRRHAVILQHDNARPPSANMAKLAIQEMDWEIFPHPAYSPDVAPSDYHLLHSLSNALHGRTFQNEADLQTFLGEFFCSKTSKFFQERHPSVGPTSWTMEWNT